MSAAEYYARNPIHFLQIAGADVPCGCEECLAQRVAQPIGDSNAAPAKATLTVFDTLESAKAEPSSSRGSAVPEADPTLQAKVQQTLLAVKKALLPLAARKQKLEQSIDSIAADVSQAQIDVPARLMQRRGRTRNS